MKISRTASYLHKPTKGVRTFLWIESTVLGDPPIKTCIEIEEVQPTVVKIKDTSTAVEANLRIGGPMRGDSGKDVHDHFIAGEFRSGDWETMDQPKPRIEIPDIPLPDPDEFKPVRPSRGLLDSARQRFRKPPP